jgi:hypothetical protein
VPIDEYDRLKQAWTTLQQEVDTMSTQVEFAVTQATKAAKLNEALERDKKQLFDQCFNA